MAIAVVVLCLAAIVQADSIPVVNHTFAEPGNGKIKGWDQADGAYYVTDGSVAEVPGWEADGLVQDSGVEDLDWTSAADDEWSGFLMGVNQWTTPEDPPVYQLLNYTIMAGETYRLTVAICNTGSSNGVTAEFYYLADEEDPTARTTITSELFAFGATTWSDVMLTFTADVASPYIGKKLGIQFSTPEGWAGIDNVRVDVGLSKPSNPDPADGAVDVPVSAVLSWSPPIDMTIASFDVYVDPNEQFLTTEDATYYNPEQTDLTFDPTPDLAYGRTYYWRVDVREPNDAVHTGDIWSFTTLSPDPKISGQPTSQQVFLGESVVFTVTAVNPFTLDDTGMSYQWYKVGMPDTEIGTDMPTLTIENITADDVGEYYCVVTVVSPPAGVTSNPTQSNIVTLLVKRLLGQWNFEDNLNDATGNGYNGTPVGTPTFTTFPDDTSHAVSGKALECIVGTGNYVQIPAVVFDDVDTQVTFSLWTYGVDQPNEGDEHAFLATDNSGAVLASMMIPHSTARIWTRIGNPVDGTDGWYEGSSAPTGWFSGQWNHWVLTKDSEAGILRVYHNGELFLESTSATKPFYGVTQFYIGGGDAAGAFGGLIDDFRIYNYALTPDEIASIHPRPMLPDPADGQINVMYNTSLNWMPGDGTSSFIVYCSDQLDSDPNVLLHDPIVVADLTEPTAILPVNLKLETTYYWYVEEYDDASQLVWTSDLWDFTVRELMADIDDNSVVMLDDLLTMAGRWTDDVRGLEDYMIDSCVYDPNNMDREDPASYANHWDTYWTNSGGVPGGTTGGNNLYGIGYCEAVDEPEAAIAWHYDTPSSSGKTDTDFIYWHRDRPRLALKEFDELRMEVKAVPGSSLKDPWWAAIDNDYSSTGDAVEYVIPVSGLGDGQWHDLVIPLSTLSGIEGMDNMRYIHAGIWGSNITGTWYIRNMRVINTEGSVRCLPMFYIPEDLNFDCFVNLEDAAIMASEWLLDARNP